MKKNVMRWWAVLAVVLVVYNVIIFAVPFAKTAVFFVSWLFTLAAIAAQVYVIRTAFYQGEGVKSKFYGFPIAKIGVLYLAVQLILGLVFMALRSLLPVPLWIPLVLYILLLGAAVIGLVAADAARDEVVRQEVKLVKDTARMRTMQARIQAIAGENTDPAAADALRSLAEAFRFSDPVSGEALAESEERLSALLAQLRQAVDARETETILRLCRQTEAQLAQRNQLCKLNKHT